MLHLRVWFFWSDHSHLMQFWIGFSWQQNLLLKVFILNAGTVLQLPSLMLTSFCRTWSLAKPYQTTA